MKKDDEYKILDKRLYSFVRPFSITFNITDKCNQKCLHCYNNSGNNSLILNEEKILNLAYEIAELKPENVCICGGEPLLSSCLFQILDILKDRVENISISTNGYLLTEGLLKKLSGFNIHTIQLSLDGCFPYQHNSFRQIIDSYEHVINALKILNSFKDIELVVAVVLNKFNYRNVIEITDLLYQYNVRLIKFVNLVPIGRGRNILKLMLNGNEYFDVLNNIEYVSDLYGNSVQIVFSDILNSFNEIKKYYIQNQRYGLLEINSDGSISINSFLPSLKIEDKLNYYWNNYEKIFYNDSKIKEVLFGCENIYDFLGDKK